VRNEIASMINEIEKMPLDSATQRRLQMEPILWGSECTAHVQWAYELIDMIHPTITTEDWTLLDCQEYLVDLEMSLTRAVTTLWVAGPGQLSDEQMKNRWELEPKASTARKLATDLRMKHLETYNLQMVTSTPVSQPGVLDRLKTSRLKLDVALAEEKGRVTDELSAGGQWRNSRTARNPEDPSARC
jgi:hypothetical protein